MLRSGLLSLLLSTLGVAQAQTPDDLSLTLSISNENIGIDNCAERIDDELVLNGTLLNSSSFENYDLRLTYTFSDSPCTRTQLGSCPGTGGSGDLLCGCLKESTSSSIEERGELSELLSAADLCAQERGTVSRLRFYLEYHWEASGEENDVAEHSEPQEIRIDFEPPSAPSEAPSVSSGEGALEIDFDEVTGDDIAEYEVCVLEAEAVSYKADDNETLRDGFTRCKSFAAPRSSYRFEGLDNEISYRVVVAAIDTAGNRSENSPVATGTPQSVRDFAEHYTYRNGGESGGCQSSPGLLPSQGGALLLLLLLGLRRKR